MNTSDPSQKITAGLLIEVGRKDGHGKRIVAWSQLKDKEREVVLMPCMLKIIGYKEVLRDGKKMTVILAQPKDVDLSTRTVDVSVAAALSMTRAKEKSSVVHKGKPVQIVSKSTQLKNREDKKSDQLRGQNNLQTIEERLLLEKQMESQQANLNDIDNRE